MELHTPRLILRELHEDDLEALRDFETRPEMHDYERETIPGEDITREFLRNAEQRAQDDPRTQYWLAVTIRPDDRVIGHVSLRCNHHDIQEWEVGWAIHSAHWGKGYATEAARALIHFAFTELQVHRVVAFCNAHNTASVRVMEKLGMRKDGHLRETRRWRGGWSDEFVYAVLDHEWPVKTDDSSPV